MADSAIELRSAFSKEIAPNAFARGETLVRQGRTSMTTNTTEREGTVTSPRREARPRAVVHHTRGTRGGPITRLVSPSDIGQLIKPFVFLDLFDFDGARAPSLDLGW